MLGHVINPHKKLFEFSSCGRQYTLSWNCILDLILKVKPSTILCRQTPTNGQQQGRSFSFSLMMLQHVRHRDPQKKLCFLSSLHVAGNAATCQVQRSTKEALLFKFSS
jgi:hypothetical protein